MSMKSLLPILALLLLFGCSKRTPKRTHIPILKDKLFTLQTAVKEKNRAAIDSLLSPLVLKKQQSSDSLLSLVYGSDGSFAFENFGGADIFYTLDKARVKCYIMDSTHTTDRELVFYYVFDHEMWLISSFKAGEEIPIFDSIDSE